MKEECSGELIGSRLDMLGLKAHLDPDQQVLQVLVIMKVANPAEDDEPNLVIASDEGTDWISQRGLLHCAREIFEQENAIRFEES